MYRSHVLVCGGTGCSSSNSQQIIDTLEAELKANGLENEVKVVKTGCFGLCALGPIVVVYPEGAFYSMVKPEDVTDEGTRVLAKEVAKRIEKEMEYPGQIRVNVIRETRSVDYAK